ncbi:DUF1848 domain-containing protein [Caproiciproducens sp. NJN-50]|uniref:DUF1848 domain-containing protein n=1 Tax=Acutalibacteraceae TaxID=3082771 RepID=UPI000FFDFA2B|nr:MULTISPECIES: DUF1848 domain-containing protein [Acutalibacteraceae]QAT49262.1 DUF1848 domain-containing protein [Caproiciproducens sp. NJN-50]
MILSASRRTDLPAFYSDWLFRRLVEGYALVRNPINLRQVSRIALSPDTVDCIVFWTKNPAPMMDKLDAIRRMGYEFYFQLTLNPYNGKIERFLPEKNLLLKAFRRLSREIGRERIVWRYDPVILTGELTPEWHRRAFRRLCEQIGDSTEECIFSFVDRYRKNGGRASELTREITPEKMEEVASGFAETALRHGIALKTCCEAIDLSRYGIGRARCIDQNRIERLACCPIQGAKDRNQRPGCGCIQSIDIGAYDTCRHGCLYCYACAGDEAVRKRVENHDPLSPLLTGPLLESDRVTNRKTASLKKEQLTLL